MKLVQFTLVNGETIYINPEYVISVKGNPYDTKSTCIAMVDQDAFVTVIGYVTDITDKLILAKEIKD